LGGSLDLRSGLCVIVSVGRVCFRSVGGSVTVDGVYNLLFGGVVDEKGEIGSGEGNEGASIFQYLYMWCTVRRVELVSAMEVGLA